eukprot:TRINITY_DN949_c3_g1_i1.p2 TRINITY_DN949_c3_g1~~TRINITY_DN949_c3_g1_i1.p2  ORF type:complete len:161 (+),score=32.44 TRINITY_DN949_c3_g1_i1:73-555(+)
MAAITPMTGMHNAKLVKEVLSADVVSRAVGAALDTVVATKVAGWSGVRLSDDLLENLKRVSAAGSCSAKLTVDGESKDFDTASASHKIHPFCEEQGIQFSCIEGTCGTCAVDVNEGSKNLNSLTDAEVAFFGDAESAGNKRLACQVQLKQGATGVVDIEK